MSQYSFTIEMPKVGEFTVVLRFYSGFEDKSYDFTATYKSVNGNIKLQGASIPDQIRNTMVGIDPQTLSEFEQKFNEDAIMKLCLLWFCV